MRRLGAVALATLVVGVACQKKDEGKQQQAAAPAAQAEAQPIVIGNVMPLTGEIATFGQGANNGVEARDRRGERRGRREGTQDHARRLRHDGGSRRRRPSPRPGPYHRQEGRSLLIGELGIDEHARARARSRRRTRSRRSPGVHEPEGHGGWRQDAPIHVPRLLHRSVPGHRDGEVRAREPEGASAPRSSATSGTTTRSGLADYFAKTFKELGGEIAD